MGSGLVWDGAPGTAIQDFSQFLASSCLNSLVRISAPLLSAHNLLYLASLLPTSSSSRVWTVLSKVYSLRIPLALTNISGYGL